MSGSVIHTCVRLVVGLTALLAFVFLVARGTLGWGAACFAIYLFVLVEQDTDRRRRVPER